MCWSVCVVIAAILIYGIARYKKKDKELRLYCLILAVSGILGIALVMTEPKAGDEQTISRKEPGEGSLTQNYEMQVEDLDLTQSYDVTVENRHLDAEEIQKRFTQAAEEVRAQCLRNNESAEHVDHDLVFVTSACEGLIRVHWDFDNYRAIDLNGRLADDLPDEGTTVTVIADLSYESEHYEYRFAIEVYPPSLSPTEAFLQDLKQDLEQKNKETGDTFELPQEIDGHAIRWKRPENFLPRILPAFALISCVALAIGKRKDEKKQKEQRAMKLWQEFPQMLSQMSLLLSAGMTAFHAWGKIVENYERGLRVKGQLRQPVYEEMMITWRQMSDGLGERAAYEQFGQRIGLQCYRKFSNLLVQNLRKGTTGLSNLLEQEVENAFADQESQIKKKGEELETKLLGPMLVMLLLVMVLILIPATAGFQFEM